MTDDDDDDQFKPMAERLNPDSFSLIVDSVQKKDTLNSVDEVIKREGLTLDKRGSTQILPWFMMIRLETVWKDITWNHKFKPISSPVKFYLYIIIIIIIIMAMILTLIPSLKSYLFVNLLVFNIAYGQYFTDPYASTTGKVNSHFDNLPI